MAEEQGDREEASYQEPPEEAWREVGREFEALGESLSRAVRAAWESEETQQHVRSMQDGLEKMVGEVDRAVREARESPEGRKLQAEAERTADSLRQAGEQTWQEARPQLVSALRKVNAELQRLVNSLEQRSASASEPPERSSRPAEGETLPTTKED